MRRIFILVPSLHPTGPIKGAVALANALAASRDVTLVSLKSGPGVDAAVDERIRQICLADRGNMVKRLWALKRLLREAGGRAGVASISLCLSADIANLFCRRDAITCASVRGNLPENYRLHYGRLGIPLAIAHLAALRGLDRVVAMTMPMAAQVSRYSRCHPVVIGNFVDEAALERYRDNIERHGPLRFVFLASLTARKRPELLLDAMAMLRQSGVDVRLELIGEGPLQKAVRDKIARLGIADSVIVHGHLRDPYPLLAQADALVLPSLSEGLSRASMEALYLGIPCVLRNADGNNELVQNGINGVLFSKDDELPAAMLAAARLSRETKERGNLLPPKCAQQSAIHCYLELLENP